MNSDEEEQLSPVDLEIFKRSVKDFNKIDEEIEKIKEKIKPYKQKLDILNNMKKEHKVNICTFMNDKILNECNDTEHNCTIKLIKSNVLKPLTRDNLKNMLIKFFDDNEDGHMEEFEELPSSEKGTFIYDYMLTHRETYTTKTIRKIKKKIPIRLEDINLNEECDIINGN